MVPIRVRNTYNLQHAVDLVSNSDTSIVGKPRGCNAWFWVKPELAHVVYIRESHHIDEGVVPGLLAESWSSDEKLRSKRGSSPFGLGCPVGDGQMSICYWYFFFLYTHKMIRTRSWGIILLIKVERISCRSCTDSRYAMTREIHSLLSMLPRMLMDETNGVVPWPVTLLRAAPIQAFSLSVFHFKRRSSDRCSVYTLRRPHSRPAFLTRKNQVPSQQPIVAFSIINENLYTSSQTPFQIMNSSRSQVFYSWR